MSPPPPPPAPDGAFAPTGCPPVRVLLVEDSPVALALLKRHLDRHPRIRVVATAANGLDALKKIPQTDPQVICTDLHMPVMDGLEFTRTVMERFPRPILVVSISVQADDRRNIFQLFEAGALDVFPKPMANWLADDGNGFTDELAARILVLANINALPRGAARTPGNGRPHPTVAIPQAPAPAVNMVVVGGGLGGPQAFREILADLPVDFPAPIVCVQHLEEPFQEDLVTWLAQHTRMPVMVAGDGEMPMAGSVYFPPRDHHLTLDSHGRLICSQAPPVAGQRPSITVTMESAALHLGPAALGILLSGVGKDGVRGLEAIAQAGGVTMAQDETSALAFETPRMAIELGAVRHILPCQAMAQALLNITGKTQADRQRPAQPLAPTRPERVLIVEDSPTQAFKLKRLLQEQGFAVSVAKDGVEGLEQARQLRPEMVVSDVSMPRMDGFTLCRTLKGDPALRHIPVMLLTALTNPGEILAGLGSGADNYLTKPYDEAVLLAHLERLLREPPPVNNGEEGLEITFEGQRYTIGHSRQQILTLLLTTYQKAVQQNRELTDSQLELKMLNLQLVDQATRQETLNLQLKEEIQRRERIEARQERLLRDQAALNRELEDFAYVVSHDLRAPVRAIGSLTHWLRSDYAPKLGSEGVELVEMLAGRAERMDQLIAAILEFTKVSRVGENLAGINMKKLVDGVVKELEPPEEIQVTVDPLPVITFDQRRAEQLFRHLIGNGIRFMDKPAGNVRVGYQAEEGEHHFTVTDDGPGIDPRHHRKIFEIFQTLQARDQLESSGVGLALCRKIVNKYGGRIWVESRLGHGSAFHFTLPRTLEPLEPLGGE